MAPSCEAVACRPSRCSLPAAAAVILMLSRSVLVIDYAATLWHVRRYKKEHRPLHLQIALHTVAAAVYLGVSFAFKVGVRSRVYMTWYFIAGTEAIASMLLSNMSPFASLTGTHLMKRLTLLTVMIMGDGIVEVGKEVVVIVRNPDAWGKGPCPRSTAPCADARRRLDNHWPCGGGRRDNLLYLPHLL